MMALHPQRQSNKKPKVVTVIILVAISIIIVGLVMLGNWQLERLDWKLALIDRIETRAFAPAVNAPSKATWSNITKEKHEYQHVTIHGEFLHKKETLVWAITEHGNGYWVITPLQTSNGTIILINRGYVPITSAEPSTRTDGLTKGNVSITGLLRISEPNGIAMRNNDPDENHWYSRDVKAIANSKNLHNVAPYFIDADM